MTTNGKIRKKKKELLKVFSDYTFVGLTKIQHEKLTKLARHVLAAEIESRIEELTEMLSPYQRGDENGPGLETDQLVLHRIKELERQLLEIKQ